MTGIETVYDLLSHAAKTVPHKTALVLGKQRMSYSELKIRADKTATGFSNLGISRGDPFAICLPNSMELVTAFYALAALGAITVWINPAYVGEQFGFILSDSGARGILVESDGQQARYLADRSKSPKPFRALPMVISRFPQAGYTALSDLYGETADRQHPLPVVEGRDICMLIYTSGATGIPKGAPATHAQVIQQAGVYARALYASSDDIFLAALPMFHSYGFISLLIQGIALGATLVIMETWDAAEALQLIENEKITVHLAAPTHYIMEMGHRDFERRNLRSLRAGLISGYVPPMELMHEIEKRMDFYFCNFWGSSETGPGLISPWGAPREKRLFTAGQPIEGEEVRIVEPATRQPIPENELGELVIRGWNVLDGYWHNPEETQRHINDEGWFHTGDLAVMDQDGFVTIAGRTKDQINRGGLKLTPYDLEKQLLRHSGVKAVSVIGTANPVLGESICACVIPARDNIPPNLRELREFVEPFVGEKCLPDELVVLEQFPMLSGGVKINKYGAGGLREWAEGDPQRQQWWKMKREGSKKNETRTN